MPNTGRISENPFFIIDPNDSVCASLKLRINHIEERKLHKNIRMKENMSPPTMSIIKGVAVFSWTKNIEIIAPEKVNTVMPKLSA